MERYRMSMAFSGTATVDEGIQKADWLVVFRRYLIVSAGGHLAWELLHLPLYAGWQGETAMKSALFLAGCIIGDISIALGALVAALLLVNEGSWPSKGYLPVASLTVAFGLASTLVVEVIKVRVFGAWAYSELMPLIPGIEVGLSPIAQWVVIPLAVVWLAGNGVPRSAHLRRPN
jgi:hypothetical protein